MIMTDRCPGCCTGEFEEREGGARLPVWSLKGNGVGGGVLDVHPVPAAVRVETKKNLPSAAGGIDGGVYCTHEQRCVQVRREPPQRFGASPVGR